MRIVSGLTISAIVLGASIGCSSTDTPASTPNDAGAVVDEASAITCTNDSRANTFAANLEKVGQGGVYRFVLVSSDPSPPVRGTNRWTVRINDAAGAPVTGSVIEISSFMPDHGHASSVKASSTEQPDHSYVIEPLYLFMPGLWQITLKATTGTVVDSAVFTFCIQG